MILWPLITAIRVSRAQWRHRFALWRLERALRLVDWQIDDCDDALLTARRHIDAAGAASALISLRALHARRLPLCDEIVALRIALGIPCLADLEYVFAWADHVPMTEMSAAEADAEVKRIRSL